ncbi:MAG: DeoR/GlpR transcriptional regulator [Rhodobacter sp.]|nr:DeoR/GlpR transcriptional regulator [Rhodobacter sp.]
MLTAQRKAHLLSRLAETGRIIARDEAQAMSLSEDTIRRDLRDLAAEGKLLRVHGGALPLSPTHLPLADRRTLQPDAKERLAVTGAKLIRQGQTVILDGGTTHLALIRHLPRALFATIVTHSPVIAAALEPFAGIDVLLIGGRLFRHSMVAVGSIASEGFASLRADLCFVGVTGLHADMGLTTGDAEEATIKRRIMEQSGETIVLATPDKIGSTSPFRIAPLNRLSTLVSIGPRPADIPAGVGHLAA